MQEIRRVNWSGYCVETFQILLATTLAIGTFNFNGSFL